MGRYSIDHLTRRTSVPWIQQLPTAQHSPRSHQNTTACCQFWMSSPWWQEVASPMAQMRHSFAAQWPKWVTNLVAKDPATGPDRRNTGGMLRIHAYNCVYMYMYMCIYIYIHIYIYIYIYTHTYILVIFRFSYITSVESCKCGGQHADSILVNYLHLL